MMRNTITICLALVASLAANAQTDTHFLDSLRRIESGKGRVEVVQSPDIDKLVNSSTATTPTTPSATTQTGKTTAETKPQAPVTSPVADHPASNDHATGKTSKADDGTSETTEPTIDTRKKVATNAYKVTGYRIQVFSGGNSRDDRQKAQDAGSRMKSAFPSEPIYVHFYSPSWKCRMGNYRDLEEARQILKQVKALGYPQACIVKGKINVSY